MPISYIGIGSNLGNRIENCIRAISEISAFGNILSVSSLYETEPVGKEDQPDFINCVVKVDTELSPHGLLVSVQSIEDIMGRNREEKWGARVIDLDILFYNDLSIQTDELTIPHPMAHLRRFVLEPLSEVAPELVHPVLKASITEILKKLDDTKRVVRIGEFFTAYSQ